ncbi:MAG: hypothetical protein ACHQM6_06245 [Candidatus Kapaibacterium sp.]
MSVLASTPKLLSAQEIASKSAADSTAIVVPDTGIKNAYGIRLGAGFRNGISDIQPIFNPYFEVPLGNLLFSAELQLVFTNFPELYKLNLDAYGWAGKFRWFYGNRSESHFFSSAGFQMVVHPDRVSMGIPLSSGLLLALSKEMEFESLVSFTPLLYLGQKLGWMAGLTFGLRFPNIK